MHPRLLLLAGLAPLLAACGGGGDSGTPAAPPVSQAPAPPPPSAPQPPAAPAPAPVVPAPGGPSPVSPAPVVPPPLTPDPVTPPAPPFSFSPGTLRATAVAGYSAAITVAAVPTASGTEAAYVGFGPGGSTLVSEPTLTRLANGTIEVKLSTLASAPAGRHTGHFTVNVCTTAQCTQQFPGAPFKLPYEINVVGPDGLLNKFDVKPLRKLTGAGGWLTVQGNAARSGHVPVTLAPASFSPRWEFYSPKQAHYDARHTFTEVATEGGALYVGVGLDRDSTSVGYMLLALGEEDGQVRWRRDFGDLPYRGVRAPAVGNGKVYVVAGDQENTTLHALDQASGTQVFAKRVYSQWPEFRAPVVIGDLVYTESGEFGGWGAYNADNGDMKFHYHLPSWLEGVSPATDADYIYIYRNTVEVLDRRTGAMVAELPPFEIPSYVDGPRARLASTTMLGSPGTVFVASVYVLGAMDTVSRRVRWQVLGQYQQNAAFADQMVFALNDRTRALEVRRESDGALQWTWTANDGAGFAGDVLVTNNLVFVSTTAGTYAIDRSSHATVWKHPAAGPLALSEYGVLYINDGALLHAINVQ